MGEHAQNQAFALAHIKDYTQGSSWVATLHFAVHGFAFRKA